jgi:hypothetical protein
VCPNCGQEKEDIIEKIETSTIHYCNNCDYPMVRATNCSHFKLKYDPSKDIVDWDGNRSRYWDEYKKQKAEGKNVRIPKHDGDG